MKVVILAGGLGTRISEESHLKPKPMIEIGGRPILWHIMKYYGSFGHNEFIICTGYKQEIIKEWFANYFLHTSDITFDFTSDNKMMIHNNFAEPWKVTVVDTGLNTMTGGRIKRIKQYIGDEPFMITYGDGVCDVNLNALVEFHQNSNKTLTISSVQPGGRFGVIDISSKGVIKSFKEKSKEDGGWINGGFMIANPSVFDYIEDDKTIFERHPMEKLAATNELLAFKHFGFWQCMDTLRDKETLESLWAENRAPWKVWD